jgi:hypothetical protein
VCVCSVLKTNEGIQDIPYGANLVEFTKSLGLRWCRHNERLTNKIMPKN